MVKMTVQQRVATFEVLPTCANLVIQALKEPCEKNPHIRVRKHTGNITMDDVIRIARKMRHKSLAKEFVGTVKEVLGTALSVGCTVEGRSPKDMTKLITEGKIDIPVA